MLSGIGCQVILWIRDGGRWGNKVKISFNYCKYLLDGKPQVGGYVNFYLHPIGGQGYEQRYFNSQEVEGRVPWRRPLLLFNQEVSSNSLQPHGPQYSRLPCPPLSPRAWLCDAIQPSHPLPPSSPFAFNLPQHQDLFQWIGSSHQMGKVLEFQLQHQSFQWLFRVDFL